MMWSREAHCGSEPDCWNLDKTEALCPGVRTGGISLFGMFFYWLGSDQVSDHQSESAWVSSKKTLYWSETTITPPPKSS